MGELLSPNPTQKQRLPKIQSPTSPFFLGSNNDSLERAQARAARAAANRRKGPAPPPPANQQDHDPCLDKQQILDLFQNCIKLASENKINQKNTWELNLIDHLCEIIKVEEEKDVETNFQKASCTLEAGVKIYSLRVDSVHSEAYKVLGGINRVGCEEEHDAVAENANGEVGQEEGHGKKGPEKKISPLSTLESSFEALNVKKFDAAFAVDPLYHQTSAQFDEGGAKGLLLNNLGVYGGCRVLFDSQEIPGKYVSSENSCKLKTIDLSFAGDCIQEMVLKMRTKDEISPTLSSIISLFDEDNKRPLDTVSSHQKSYEHFDEEDIPTNEVEFDGDTYENCGNWTGDHDDQRSVIDEDPNDADATFPSYHEENEPFTSENPDTDDRYEEVDGYLFFNLGFTSKQNDWAGPDHWKYRKVKGSEDRSAEDKGSPATTKRSKPKKQAEIDVDFSKALGEEMPDIFVPPKNPKSLLLPANRAPCNRTLPEDCHYQPVDLVKLFLRPNVMCLGKRRKRNSDQFRQQFADDGPLPSWDDENGFGDQFADGNSSSDVEDNTLVSQPRQVNKIEVNYDKTSKQVDVQSLKETIWNHMQGSPELPLQKDQNEGLSFKNLLASFPSDCGAAATTTDISPHLCFICLLHLANEHGLSIHGCASLDDLSIYLPEKDIPVNEAVSTAV
ncbi:hypothetical protein Tsubulata_040953 [Turnera subulata]|uniref:Condensin complex subunit 2 n=1 Tax=Turnera subulata TaxID=218843 RepID=A0A9Q0GGE8_9ROSI|nr:hypothetical protein Tsubulata_040953 [Turnera subulata]